MLSSKTSSSSDTKSQVGMLKSHNFQIDVFQVFQRHKHIINHFEPFTLSEKLAYRKIPNISPGLIEVRKHILGAYIRGGLYSGGLILGGHFVLVSGYQNFEMCSYM